MAPRVQPWERVPGRRRGGRAPAEVVVDVLRPAAFPQGRWWDGYDEREVGVAPDLAFDALADPVRREILAVLADEAECSSGALAERITSVGRTAVSSHLRVLKNAGLVAERRDGRFRYYSIDASGSARDVLALLHQVFRAGLDDIERAVPVPEATDPARRHRNA